MFQTYIIDSIKDYDLRFKLQEICNKHNISHLSEFERDLLEFFVNMITSIEQKLEDLDATSEKCEQCACDAENAEYTSVSNLEKAEEALKQIPDLADQLNTAKILVEDSRATAKAIEYKLDEVIKLEETKKEFEKQIKINEEFRQSVKTILDELVTFLEKPKTFNLRDKETEPKIVLKIRGLINEPKN
jgi:hypothetical protein